MSYTQMPGGQPPMPGGPPPKQFAPSMPAPAGPGHMQYMRSYNYIFENPNWMMNVLWGFLCIISTALIPIVGQLIYLGYIYETIEMLYLTGGSRYPDFDINKFGDYLMRGLWPFLVQMLVTFVSMIVLIPLFAIGMAVLGAIADGAGRDAGGAIAGFGMLVLMGFFVAAMLLLGIILTPLTLRAGLTQDFGQGMNIGWAKDFVRKVWMEIVLAGLFLMATGIVLWFLGALALCIGIYAAAAIVILASAHLNYQLYAIYLGRGGEPIPLKPKFPPQMTAPPPMPQY